MCALTIMDKEIFNQSENDICYVEFFPLSNGMFGFFFGILKPIQIFDLVNLVIFPCGATYIKKIFLFQQISF